MLYARSLLRYIQTPQQELCIYKNIDKNTFLLRNILAKEGNEEVMDGKGCLVNIQIYPIRKCRFSFKTHTKKGFPYETDSHKKCP